MARRTVVVDRTTTTVKTRKHRRRPRKEVSFWDTTWGTAAKVGIGIAGVLVGGYAGYEAYDYFSDGGKHRPRAG